MQQVENSQMETAARPLVILDINGVLMLSTHRPVARATPSEMANKKYLYYRPHMHEFLEYLFEHYNVAFWTSQMRHNAEETLRKILTPEQIQKLLFVWTRTECLLYPDYSSKKPIEKVFEHFARDKVDPHKTVIVDDSIEKMTTMDYFMHIKSYLLPRDDDQELLIIRDKLNQRLTYNAKNH